MKEEKFFKTLVMVEYKCDNGCCNFFLTYYNPTNERKMIEWIKEERKKGIRRKKAGIFLYDPNKEKILLVQSHGKFWGIPKGTKEENETFVECATRETKEETGLEISEYDLTEFVVVENTTYYIYPYKTCNVKVQSEVENNDANGIGWFSYKCIKDMSNKGKMILNKSFKLVSKKVLNLDY